MTKVRQTTRNFLEIGDVSLHYTWLGDGYDGAPIVFLHEGLGSVELWRDFPSDLVRRVQRPALLYSRVGNGWSSPSREPKRPDYLHLEALETLPRVIAELVGRPPIIIGHSDGASIAIVYAGAGHPVQQLVLIAPHVLVETSTIRSISTMRDDFRASDMADRMGKYHIDPEATFHDWANIWLSPEFRTWTIEQYLTGVRCPTLLIQGDEDEYGSTRQLEAVESGAEGPVERLIVGAAGHSPHLSHPEVVTEVVADFIRRHDR